MKMLHGAMDICTREVKSLEVESGPEDLDLLGDRWRSEWVLTRREENQELVGGVINSLEILVTLTKHSNDAQSDGLLPLTELQRAQLVAALETALAMLKSPMVEVGLLRRLRQWLQKIVVRSAEKQLETALSSAATSGFEAIGAAVEKLAEN